jgi:hypothetical protein
VIDLDSLKPEVEAIGKELIASGVLNQDERTKVGKWTLAMGMALATGDAVAIGNYKTALSTMLGVAELRAAQASEKAALRMADLALSVVVKIALAAL